MNQQNKKSSEADKLFDVLSMGVFFLITVNTKILGNGIKRLTVPDTLLGLFLFILSSIYLAMYDYHLLFLQWINPKFFHMGLLVELKEFGVTKNVIALTSLFILITVWFMGIVPTLILKRYQNALDNVSLKNGFGSKAKVTGAYNLDSTQKVVKIMLPGIGIDKLRRVKESLESSFQMPISEIKSCKNPRFAEIILGEQKLTSKVNYVDNVQALTQTESFLIGESKNGIMTSKISNLPHMLVAGTTGGGKSVFFKQALLGLLESSDHLQMYLIDLKGGLEFRHFNSLPNVKVVKTIQEAVMLLQTVKDEMESRFKYLEESENEKIIPYRDKRDRIIVGIDEASVLYANASRDSEDYHLIIKARNLTEHIAKLSRAAGIHLIFATQKVTKETIDTRIQENVSARMCFKLNTPEGSIRVLGNAKACDLPNIPGRGIWQLGNTQVEVQAPNIDTDTLKDRLHKIYQDYHSKDKKLYQKMLDSESVKLLTRSIQDNSSNHKESFEGL